jgi:membrane protein
MGDLPRPPPTDEKSGSTRRSTAGAWRRRYEGSAVQELVRRLDAVDFANRIVLFGAALLLSVLPVVILLSALASTRVDDDIARHLGLDQRGARTLEGLFRSSPTSFSGGVVIALVLSVAGTIAVAGAVQVIYERAFEVPHRRGLQNLLRCAAWAVCMAALLVADGAISPYLRDAPAGPLVLGLGDFVGLFLFYWWTMHFLLAGRESWRRLLPAAVATGLFWVGLGVFASFYLSSTIISDNKLYGKVGVVFDLVTWFIAIGAVLTLGAVVGALWQSRRSRTRSHTGDSRKVGSADRT